MTKEQEVIKYIETRIKICNENADICDDNDFDEEATYLREESYMLETVLSMLKEKDKEIEKKDKIIDRTAITIIQRDIGKDYCEFNKSCEKCENGSRDLKCKECIRQYFEREVDSSEQN